MGAARGRTAASRSTGTSGSTGASGSTAAGGSTATGGSTAAGGCATGRGTTGRGTAGRGTTGRGASWCESPGVLGGGRQARRFGILQQYGGAAADSGFLDDGVLLDLDLEVEQAADRLFLDPVHHGGEHVVALALVLHQRVAL